MSDLRRTCQRNKETPYPTSSQTDFQIVLPHSYLDHWAYPTLPGHGRQDHNSNVNFQANLPEQLPDIRHEVHPYKHYHQVWEYGVGDGHIGNERRDHGRLYESFIRSSCLSDHRIHEQTTYPVSGQTQRPAGHFSYTTDDQYCLQPAQQRFERLHHVNKLPNDQPQRQREMFTNQDDVTSTTTFDWTKQKNVLDQSDKTRTKDKYRVVYTDQQRAELEKEYHRNKYINARRKSEVASLLGLSERQVKIWFQNRRAKERRQRKNKEERETGHQVNNADNKPPNNTLEYQSYPQHSSNQHLRDNVLMPKWELKNHSDLFENTMRVNITGLTSHQGPPNFCNLRPFDNSLNVVSSITSSDHAHSAIRRYEDEIWRPTPPPSKKHH